MSKTVCCSCHRTKPASKQDPAFCQGCFDRIEEQSARQESLVRGYRCLSMSHGTTKREDVFAFLNIFHPDMSERRKTSILLAVDDDGQRRCAR